MAQPAQCGRRFLNTHWSMLGMLLPTLLMCGCGGSSAGFDCGGTGTVRGRYSEINSGTLEFAHGLFWGNDVQGYRVLFTDDPLLAEALRASPDPGREAPLAANMLQVLLVGYDFKPDGNYRQHFTFGSGNSSGWSGADRGEVSIDSEGCARGDVHLDHPGDGHFALPRLHPEQIAAALNTDVEIGGATQGVATAAGGSGRDDSVDMLQTWRAAYRRLHEAHPATALQALGFSAPVASVLAAHPGAKLSVERMRNQCPDPATASLNEYGEVIGEARPTPVSARAGVPVVATVLSGTAMASFGGDGAVIDNCYVMKRNDEWIDQCWPISTDCTTSKRYEP